MLKRRSSFQVGGSVPSEEKPLRIPREYASLVGLDDIDSLFKTSRGSTYAYHANKTSTRNRSGEQHTDKTTGIQPRSGKTVFMSNDDVNKVAGIFQNAEMATQLVPVMDEQGRPTGKAKLELLEDYGPRKKGSTLITVSYTTTPAVGLAPVEIYRSESKMGDSGRGIHFGTPITEVINKPVRAAGKAGLMAAALGAAGGASAADIAESFLPLGMTPSPLAPGTLTPEQKEASDEAYRRKLAEERAAKMKAQALLRSGVKQEEPQMAKGGMMARNIPGFQEGGANIDPVSGNDVPVGSLPEEVRDDIDAKLSPGEFVIPADVVRFIGLERLMKMRDEAKKGLQRMSEIGQMGNADEVGEESNSTYEDEGFESEIDDILSEIEAEENGRDVNEQTEVMMAEGGFMKSGTDLTKAPKNPVFDVRYYKNAEGSVMYITHINGKPMTPIPEGYKAVTQEEAQKVGQKAEEAAKATQASTQANESGSYDATQLDPSVVKFLENETKEQRDERLGKINTALSNVLPAAAKAMIPGMGLMTLAQKAAGLFADQTRPTPAPVTDVLVRTPAQIAAGTTAGAGSMIEAAAADAYSRAQDENLGDVAASRAAASAAEAVSRGVDPASAIQAAIEAEQDIRDRSDIGDIFSSRGTSSAVSPPSVADTSPVSSTGGGIASRDLGKFDPGIDRSGSFDYGGSSYGAESSVGTPDSGRGEPDSFSTGDWGGFARGGLVNKRQYPAKKKRGKGLASAKNIASAKT